jgi:hypothetical protein
MTAALDNLPKHFPAVHAAANELMLVITNGDIRRDIILSAELAGLMMLRQGAINQAIDLSKFPAGAAVLGTVPDEMGSAMMSFVLGFARQNGLPAINPESPIGTGPIVVDSKAGQMERIGPVPMDMLR